MPPCTVAAWRQTIGRGGGVRRRSDGPWPTCVALVSRSQRAQSGAGNARPGSTPIAATACTCAPTRRAAPTACCRGAALRPPGSSPPGSMSPVGAADRGSRDAALAMGPGNPVRGVWESRWRTSGIDMFDPSRRSGSNWATRDRRCPAHASGQPGGRPAAVAVLARWISGVGVPAQPAGSETGLSD